MEALLSVDFVFTDLIALLLLYLYDIWSSFFADIIKKFCIFEDEFLQVFFC